MHSASPTQILILGASTRAAAHSAVRAGWSPICVDGFADADLREIAEVVRVDDYPSGLRQAASQVPIHIPWMYTGGLENHRDIVSAVCDSPAGKRELLGNDASVLRLVRDPFKVAAALRQLQLPMLEVRSEANPPPLAERWLIKARRGSGGKGVRMWESSASTSVPRPCYFQKFREGESISGLYVAAASGTSLLGVTCQLTGAPGSPFGYAGSLAPWPVSERCRSLLQQVGACVFGLCEGVSSGLRGLFGIDFILADDVPWLTEVNPRWTASAELLESSLGRSLLQLHERACRHGTVRIPPLVARDSRGLSGMLGKKIVYASGPTVTTDMTEAMQGFLAPGSVCLPALADIPEGGTRFQEGQPICTVFAQAETATECLQILNDQANWFSERYTTILESL